MDDGQTVEAMAYTEPPAPVLLAATYNPREMGYGGMGELGKATKNRFAMQFNWDYDREVEKQLLDSETLLDLAYGLRAREEIHSPVPTNALQELESNWWRYGWAPAARFFINRFDEDEQNIVELTLQPESENIERELIAAEQSNANAADNTMAMVVAKPTTRRRRTTK
jgi:hypothetical protein